VLTTRLLQLAATALALLALPGCEDSERGPLRVVAIGAPPAMVNPSSQPAGTASGLLLEAVAQGLVRFDAAGEIEPALAQSWIVSDDGRRYTFRLRRTLWARGDPVTARQIVERLRAAISRNSRNGLRPVLGAIEQIEAMTEQVLEIRLKAPRPNFLQLLAQPELAIVANGEGTGPYRMGGEVDGALRLVPPPVDEDAEVAEEVQPEILLRADPAPAAIARFVNGQADLVTGGTIGDVPLLAAARLPEGQTAFDPVRGLFGLTFLRSDGLLAQAPFRQALSMSLDREGMLARFVVPGLQPRVAILPPGLSEVPNPAVPDWAAAPLPTRREIAARIVADLADVERPRLRVALPPGPGYRIVFAHIRRDWRFIGVDAVAVAHGAEAELRLIDEVAPADLAPWYLRHFLCGVSAVCDQTADLFMQAARDAPLAADRHSLLAQAERMLGGMTAYIPIAPPVRWSLRSGRLNGFRTNVFARHALTELIASED
jgi:peptide/nickel transport system substrate-binding protein